MDGFKVFILQEHQFRITLHLNQREYDEIE